MGFNCLAGWTELQDYKAAKAILWLWGQPEPETQRLLVFWEPRGHTGESGANFWLCLGDTSNDHPMRSQSRCYPITAPSKKDGSFRLKNPDHVGMIRWELLNIEPDEPKYLESIKEQIPVHIARYEAIKAPLGSRAWLNPNIPR